MIAELQLIDLAPGVLFNLFRDGAAVALIDFGATTRKLWQRLVQKPDEVLPWELPISDIAANHHGSADITQALGDVIYFQPGLHGYIGRKIEIERSVDGDLKPIPASFRQNGQTVPLQRELIGECCDVVDTIMAALAPQDRPARQYRVAMQRLKYQASAGEFEMLSRMTSDSLARWGRLGFQIDRNRGALHHRLSGRWASDILGVMMTMPGGRNFARWISEDVVKGVPGDTPDARTIVERPHTDGRYFSALCGDRQSVRTEFLYEGKWQNLPVTTDKLAIMPGDLAKRDFGLKPVLHRVIYPNDLPANDIDDRCGNVTLLFGAT
ncbi:hypothetical protein [Croceibacterium atlanticum]|uniref:hypothetical protein n=1 Tax=Croceibacterium atlanticum TaxID=1267766 RepID=UPI0014708047|nr:hypothetical protein [Croceibacterium atlanticum]